MCSSGPIDEQSVRFLLSRSDNLFASSRLLTSARARLLRSDRALARARSLRSDRAEHAFGLCVATELRLELGRYVATERNKRSVGRIDFEKIFVEEGFSFSSSDVLNVNFVVTVFDPDKNEFLRFLNSKVPTVTPIEMKQEQAQFNSEGGGGEKYWQLDGIQSHVTELNRARVEVTKNPKLSSEVQSLKEKLNEHSKQLEQSAEKLSQLESKNLNLRDENQALNMASNKKRRFGAQIRPMPTLKTPNSGTGVNLPPTASQGDAAMREKAKDAQTYDVEDSKSEPEPDKEAPEGAAKTESPLVAVWVKNGYDEVNVQIPAKFKYVFSQQIMLDQENVATYVPEIKLRSNSV
ncbi:hypothetical protein DY000_02046140 [Brassica cretica]|uniref:Uncharacterized protein n=1 Tax=Brassica cretica TaxID=69181 RepID=A0ABQ7EZE2_BRACR|nr:hypothetical protein DY000_02046140 [Brassica cretica]